MTGGEDYRFTHGTVGDPSTSLRYAQDDKGEGKWRINTFLEQQKKLSSRPQNLRSGREFSRGATRFRFITVFNYYNRLNPQLDSSDLWSFSVYLVVTGEAGSDERGDGSIRRWILSKLAADSFDCWT